MSIEVAVGEHGRIVFQDLDGRRFRWKRPSSKQQLAIYVRTFFGLTLAPRPHPDCVARGHAAPLDVAWSAYSAQHGIMVVKASRGLAGKSTMLAAVSALELLEGMNVIVLGGSASQSRRVRELCAEMWDRRVELDGKAYRAPLRHLIEDRTASEIRATHARSWLRALPASPTAVRGPHPHRLRIDEADEMSIEIFDAAMGQTLSDDPRRRPAQTTIASTHQHAQGTMTEVLRRARERGWPVFEFCYRDVLVENGGWLAESEVERKRNEVTGAMWETEYELQEPAIEGRAIDTAAVDRLFDRRWGRYGGVQGEYLEFPCCEIYIAAKQRRKADPSAEEPRPCTQHQYATGADWGRRRDQTAIVTYRTDTPDGIWWLVAWETDSRRPWDQLVERFNRRVRRFPGPAAHDASGLGDAVGALIEVQAEGVVLTGGPTGRRAKILNDYIVGIEDGSLIGPRVDSAWHDHRYVTVDDLWGSGHLPDCFIAGALAWHCRSRVFDPRVEIGGITGPGPLSGVR